jgi:diguanylate cyclase (GGDEF)-like protein
MSRQVLHFLDGMALRLPPSSATGAQLVKARDPNRLLRTIADHPRASAQDGILIAAAMCVAVLLALEYDLLRFADRLTEREREITLAEVIILTGLLGLGIVGFILRRLQEERSDIARRLELDLEMRELRAQALQDPLTALPNRRAIMAALAQATAGPRCDGRRHAFFVLDLNDFKCINDRYGHAEGDRVLQVVVERLRKAARPSDELARLGGDEFGLIAYDVDRNGAQAIGQRFIAALEHDMWVDGYAHNVGVSVGATLIPDDGVTVKEILNNADLAMYQAKVQGGSALAFFDTLQDGAQRARLVARS